MDDIFNTERANYRKRDPEVKKKEIFNLIDTYSQPSFNNSNNNQSQEFSNRTYSKFASNDKPIDASNYLSPRGRRNPESETYWNDWFGRPGAGAPMWTSYKQNLDKMLEPKSNDIFYYNQPYVPTIVSQAKSPRRNRSNHHNRYELA